METLVLITLVQFHPKCAGTLRDLFIAALTV